MREAIGNTHILFIVIVIVVVIMMLISGSINYSKAFKARNAILNIIQENGSYGKSAEKVLHESEEEIDLILSNMGYKTTIGSNHNCAVPSKHKDKLVDYAKSPNYNFCVYHFSDGDSGNEFYGIETYMYFELPIFGRNDRFSFPIFGETYMFYRIM